MIKYIVNITKYFVNMTKYFVDTGKGLSLKMLHIGTPKTINFPFVPNGKLMVFRCPNTYTITNKAIQNQPVIWYIQSQVSYCSLATGIL